jgi:hypothetical protein
VVGDDPERQVGAREGGLDNDHADRQQGGECVGGAAGRVSEAAVAPRPRKRGHPSVDGDSEGQEEAGGADRDHAPAITR